MLGREQGDDNIDIVAAFICINNTTMREALVGGFVYSARTKLLHGSNSKGKAMSIESTCAKTQSAKFTLTQTKMSRAAAGSYLFDLFNLASIDRQTSALAEHLVQNYRRKHLIFRAKTSIGSGGTF
jgi:hypothetical protein